MGRKSVLTEQQWADIDRRVIDGDSICSIARDYGVGESTIRSRIVRTGKKFTTVRQVAQMANDTVEAFNALDAGQQAAALKLAPMLRNMSLFMAQAAEASSETASVFAQAARSQARKVDLADPLAKPEPLRNAIALQEAANKAFTLPAGLASSQKEGIKQALEDEEAGDKNDELTPERLAEGARRIAFTLNRAAHSMENT